MTTLTPRQRFAFSTQGQLYYWLYRTISDRFFGIAWADWLRLLTLLLVPVLWLQTGRFPWTVAGLALVVRLLYWLVASRNFARFVPQKGDAPPAAPAPLPPDKRLSLRATGLFYVAERAERVLLRPATFWQVPLGTRVVMVEKRPDSFLYQLLKIENLIAVEAGWLLFGPEPLETLAVTFLAKWPPGEQREQFVFTTPQPTTVVAGDRHTIYLTFDDTTAKTAVWHNLTRETKTPQG